MTEPAVVPDIAGRDVSLPTATEAQSADAAAEISRFDAELGAEIAPFSAILLRTESAASSKIENLTASARAIAEAELHPSGGNAALIVANTRALTAAIALANNIDGTAILAMHDALLAPSQPDIAGRWRSEQVWIGGSDFGPHGASFVPPHHGQVPAAIEDLIAFIRRDDIPTLTQAALAHAQFETIHPFPDGNGRTGRALLHAELRNKGLTRNVTVPVSAGLLTNIDAYFAALTQYREGDPAAIVEALASATYKAVDNGRELVGDLRAIRNRWDERIKARRGTNAWKIVDLILGHPVVDVALIADELGIERPNVYGPLQPLLNAEVLVEFTDRKRNQMWHAPEVLEALDRFALRAGRRVRSSR